MEIASSSSEGQDSPSTMLFCRMCQAVYRQPKILPCLHSFCRPCLVDAVSHRQQEGTVIVCPLCSYQANLPPSGIVGVPDNVFLNRMCQEYVSEVQSHLAAKTFHSPSAGSGAVLPGVRAGGELTKLKQGSDISNARTAVRRSSQDTERESDSPPGALAIGRGPASGQSTATALEAIRNMSRLQNKILSLQGDALRVTYAIEEVNQSTVDWHQHKEDLKKTIQRRSSQFQFFIKRMEHHLLSQIEGKHPDDDVYGESDQSKTRLREVLKNILHEVSVLKSVQEFGKDAEINSLSGNLLGKSVGMSDVKLKKFQFKMNTPIKSIEDIVAESFGKVDLTSVESTVFSPEIIDFTNIPVGGAGEGSEGVLSGVQTEKRDVPVMDTEQFENAISRATTSKRSSDRRSRRHNTDLGLDKEDVREYLAQFQTARETFRTRRREILAQGHRREDASPFREEAPRRPQSPLGRGRVQSLDRRAMPATRKDKSVLPSKPDITQITTTASRQPDIMPENPPEDGTFQYVAAVSHPLPGVIPEDITLPSPVIEETTLPTSPQRVLVKQTSDPRSTYEMPTSSSDDKSGAQDISPPSHTQSLMEQLRSRRFSQPVVSHSGQRRYSDQPTSFFPSDHQMTLDLQGHDRVSTRPLRRAISGASDRKSKMEFLRETWQKRKEILMQNEGFIPSETPSPRLDHVPSTLKSPPAAVTSSPSQSAALEVTPGTDIPPITAEVTTQAPASVTAASPDDTTSRMLQIRNRLAHYRNELASSVSGQESARQDRSTTKAEREPRSTDQSVPASVHTESLDRPTPTEAITASASIATTALSSLSTPTAPTPATYSTALERLTATLPPAAATTSTTTTAASAITTRESRYSRYISKPTEKSDVTSLIAAMYSGREKSILHTQAHTSAPSTPASQNGITATTTTSRDSEATTTSYSRSYLSSRPSATAADASSVAAPPTTDNTSLSTQSAVTATITTTTPYQSEYRRYRYGLASRESSQDTTRPSDQTVNSQSSQDTTATETTTTTQPTTTNTTTSQYQSRRSRYGVGSRDGAQGINRRHTIEIGRDAIRSALRVHAEKYPQVLETIPDSPAMQQEQPPQPPPTAAPSAPLSSVKTGVSLQPTTGSLHQQAAVQPMRLLDRLRYGDLKKGLTPTSSSPSSAPTSSFSAPTSSFSASTSSFSGSTSSFSGSTSSFSAPTSSFSASTSSFSGSTSSFSAASTSSTSSSAFTSSPSSAFTSSSSTSATTTTTTTSPTVRTSRLPAPDPESIPDTTIAHHITARGVTTKTIPYPLVLEHQSEEEQRSPISPRLDKDSPAALVAALASGRPMSPSASPTSPTAGDVAAKGRLRELARKKKERWRHLTIH